MTAPVARTLCGKPLIILKKGDPMFFRTILLTCLLFPFISFASPRLSPDSMSALIKAYSLATNPNLTPDFRLVVTEYEVKDLYDSLGIQVFHADFLSQDGTWFRSGGYLYLNGTVTLFSDSFGGWRLMSGVVVKRTFYYTYSWGSGIHRSHVGCLFLDGDSLIFLDTGGFMNFDLFVSNCASDSICVYTGVSKSFNSWILIKDDGGRVIDNNKSRLAVIDSTGKEVLPDIPLNTRDGIKVRGSNVSGGFSKITDNLIINVKGQVILKPTSSSVLINKKRSLVIFYDNARLDKLVHTFD